MGEKLLKVNTLNTYKLVSDLFLAELAPLFVKRRLVLEVEVKQETFTALSRIILPSILFLVA